MSDSRDTRYQDANIGRHVHYAKKELVPFKSLRSLGTGGDGEVDEVASTIDGRRFARKRVRRPRRSIYTRDQNAQSASEGYQEIEILRKTRHPHVIQFCGSYTDPTCLGILMLPVAEMDLSEYLGTYTHTQASILRKLQAVSQRLFNTSIKIALGTEISNHRTFSLPNQRSCSRTSALRKTTQTVMDASRLGSQQNHRDTALQRWPTTIFETSRPTSGRWGLYTWKCVPP
ncbi:hypothetical protein BDV96DRAFT_602489 [Lophiotrema nucula]|uniref:Protein kinase domain-containing protein n=1 Tax=Lophiotrema nucula TaxID=690887 RepID=A0A6A5YYP8_9PLEO|nr:hypothetical protein BDV96DRAFT_602489 [Lophiotrema nucula]